MYIQVSVIFVLALQYDVTNLKKNSGDVKDDLMLEKTSIVSNYNKQLSTTTRL
uniref:Uncharacterized protein n=1 Tax=Arundo donax TaxID=35708 RepID=A0A0A9FKC9_ARUDO